LRLAATDIGLSVDDLALEIRLVHDVELDDPEGADSGGCEVHGDRGAEAAGPDAQDLRRFEPGLALHRDLGHDQVPRVAADLIEVEVLSSVDDGADLVSTGH
jgi:hypothetical protein